MLQLLVSRPTSRPVLVPLVIPPHAVLCELQPVALVSGEEREEAAAELKSYMDKIHISSEVLMRFSDLERY